MYKRCKAAFTGHLAPSSLNLLDGSVTSSAKERAKALLNKFFPDDLTAQDSVQQKNIRAQVSGSEPPASQAVPNIKNHEVDEVIKTRRTKNVPDRMELTELL